MELDGPDISPTTPVYAHTSAYNDINVTDHGFIRVLSFGGHRQSSMYLDAPFDTDFEYPSYFHIALAVTAGRDPDARDRPRRRQRGEADVARLPRDARRCGRARSGRGRRGAPVLRAAGRRAHPHLRRRRPPLHRVGQRCLRHRHRRRVRWRPHPAHPRRRGVPARSAQPARAGRGGRLQLHGRGGRAMAASRSERFTMRCRRPGPACGCSSSTRASIRGTKTSSCSRPMLHSPPPSCAHASPTASGGGSRVPAFHLFGDDLYEVGTR